MSARTNPSSILPPPLRETALAYLGSVFLGIDLLERYVRDPLRGIASRYLRERSLKGRPAVRPKRGRKRAR